MKTRAGDDEYEVRRHGAIWLGKLGFFKKSAADLFKRFLRSDVVLSDHEQHPINKAKGVTEHERF